MILLFVQNHRAYIGLGLQIRESLAEIESVCSRRTQFSDRRKLAHRIEHQIKLERARLNVSFQVKIESESVWNATELFEPSVPGNGFAIYRTKDRFFIQGLEKMSGGSWKDYPGTGCNKKFSIDGHPIGVVVSLVAAEAARILRRTVREKKARE